MIITLVRHGEIDNDYLGCYNGHIDISLSTKGIAASKQLAEYFRGSKFDAIYSSDLIRCKETLSPLIENSKFNIKNLILTPLLREKSWGKHEGMTYDAITERDGLSYKHFEQWINALDGEPYDTYIARIRHFFLEFLPLEPYDSVLVMTHAGVIRVLYAIILELSLEKAFTLPFPYAAYTTLDTKTWQFGALICAA
ncbi:MAG: histidine phosphatase family protein [Epsilonproteobacteria bacterium]|nr:MAG: histidine phosphatase family protein [Campylobacterota bacterium]